MLLPRALLVPHWPTLLEDEHRRHRTPMLEALAREGRRFLAERPDAVVILSARWESSGPFHVGDGRFHRTITDDPAFGVEARYDCEGHPALARRLVDAGVKAGVRVGPSDRGVDGGVIVPLHFLVPSRGLRVVPLSIADRPVEECRSWGAVIRRVLESRPERIGFVVSGMLSSASHAWKFGRQVPDAVRLDEVVLEALKAGEWSAIRPAADKWRQRAHPEAELRHLEVLRGFLGEDLAGEVLAYEAGPGIGAALVAYEVPGAVSVASPEDLIEPVTVTVPAPPRRRVGSNGKRDVRKKRDKFSRPTTSASRTPKGRRPPRAPRPARKPRG